ncbi:MAG: hypothetical protein PF904_08505 [Kiritimatiellae bacterium]|jgi:hypothetical protein|nr:hypothetical protein [Kiritimatiellia bacterium]
MNDEFLLKRLAALFGIFTLICIAAGASRVAPNGWNFASVADILRVREMLSMLVFAPLIGIMFWMFNRCLAQGRQTLTLDILCILSIYFVACGMGMHDPANRLISAYNAEGMMSKDLRYSIQFIDDQLGHWVFWTGFILGTWCICLQQLLMPLKARMSLKWTTVFLIVSLLLLGVMLTNLWDEYPKTITDLYVIGGAIALPVIAHLLIAPKVSILRLPVLSVLYPAYIGSIIGTLICWQCRYQIFSKT